MSAECARIEADAIWAFVGAKKANATTPDQDNIWTFTALDPDTKLMVTWFVGSRTEESTSIFMDARASRLVGRV